MAKKLRGHKKGCRCVACSPMTRLRGRARLALRRSGLKITKKGWLKPIKRRRPAQPNPPRRFIGSSPALHTRRGYFSFPGGTLLCGADSSSFVIHSRRGKLPPLGARISRVDYTNEPKALRAAGRRGPFYHTFTSSPWISGIETRPGGSFSIYVRGTTRLWRSDQ